MKPDFLKEILFSPPASVGLDLGNYSVKIAQVKKSPFSKERMLYFGIAQINPRRSREDIIEAVKEAYKKSRIDSNRVNLSICGPNVIMRYIMLPLMNENDLHKSLEFELEKYIPYKKGEAVTDYHILTKLPSNKMLVLLVSVERRVIEERVSLIQEAGLEAQLINVDTLALIEAFKLFSPFRGAVAVLDIGYNLSKLVVLENNIPYFSRDIETGEYDIVQTIAEKMAIDFKRAKELAYNPAGQSAEIAQAVKLTLNSLTDEVFLSFEYCERNLDKEVGQFYLSGGGSRIKALLDSLNKGPKFKIELLNPTLGLKINPSVSTTQLNEAIPLLGVAVGLALS